MNPISHKQALQWIDRRLDGLLAQKQLSLLDEHLHSCEECRAYASEMDKLPAQLQNEFHARWDAKPGPSPKVLQTVAAKARNIPMRNRIASGAKLLAGAATLILLGIAINFVVSQVRDISATTGTGTETVSVLPRAEDRLLAFASIQNGNSDIYIMHPDGSRLTNLTNDPAYDGNPFWSPDGRQIAFMSDRSGSSQLYLMDADGSNVIQLTNAEGNSGFDSNGYSPWSPDGTRLTFVNKLPEEQYWRLYILNLQEKTSLVLTSDPGAYLLPSWSPDGEHIVFLNYESESRPLIRHLFVIDKNGNNLAELTEPLRIEETNTSLAFQYHWSRDGASVFFEARSVAPQTPNSTVYEASLDGSLTIKTQSEGFVIDWWEGTTLQQEQNARTLTWLRPDGSQSALEVCPGTEQPLGTTFKRSKQGSLLFGANCSATGWKLYWANPDGTSTSKLTEGTIPARDDGLYAITWSPDDRFIAFLSMDSDSSTFVHTLYILDVEQARNDPSVPPLKMVESYGPAWQPVIESKVVEEPTPIVTAPSPAQADSRLLAFPAVAENGNLDIFTMRPDGSQFTNLTDHPAQDVNPFWSPDGTRIAFESTRDGLEHIYSMNADGSEVIRLTEGEARYEIGAPYGMNSTPWSPDGAKLIFSLWPAGETTRTLYVMDVDGRNKTPLVSEPSNYYSFPSWSPDGQRIAFIEGDPTNTATPHLHIVNADGSQPMDVGQYLPENESLWAYNNYSWSPDGQSIFFIAEGQDQWIVYEFSLSDRQMTEHTRSSEPIGDWWRGTAFITGRADDRLAPVTWLRWDGTSTMLKPFETCESVSETQYGLTYQRSSRGSSVIAAHCPNGGWWLYWADEDGTAVKQLLATPITGEEFAFSNIAWSPNDRFISFKVTSGNLTELYILDVEAALQDPSTQPLKATTMGREMFYNSSWQPIRITRAADPSVNVQIDPQSCKPFSDPSFETPPPSQLYGYEPIQGISFVDGDFSYDFWLYCDPASASDSEQNSNAKVGLGIFSSWDYTGPLMEGPVEYHYEFGPNIVLGGGNWDGLLYSTSITGAKLGVDLMEIQAYIQQGLPIPFRVVIDSPPGKKEAVFSFKLEPTKSGLQVTDLQAKQPATSQSGDQQLIFTLNTQDGDLDIFVAPPDRSEPVNLTDHPANDDHPAWSPDGRRIAFESDRNGSSQIYLMDADGSNLVQVTAGEAEHKFLNVENPWSPDGTRLLIRERTQPGNTAETDEWTLFVVSLDGQTKTELARMPAVDLVKASWAPDGEHVAFIVRAAQSARMQIQVVDADGNNPAEVTKLLPADEELLAWEYSWAADGQSIFFLAGRTAWDSSAGQSGRNVAYEASLDGETLSERTVSGTRMLDWWEGTALVAGTGAELPFKWLRADGTSQTWKPFEHCGQDDEAQYGYMHDRSPNGNLLFAVYCPNNELWLYWTNSDGSVIKQLLDTPIYLERFDIYNFTWSPDDRLIAYNIAHPTELIDLYILDVEAALKDSSTQPVKLVENAAMLNYLSWQPGP